MMTIDLFSVLIDAALRGVVVLVIAGVVVLALRNPSSAVRHLVWAVALAGLLVVPVLRLAAPDVPVPMKWAASGFVLGDGDQAGPAPVDASRSRAAGREAEGTSASASADPSGPGAASRVATSPVGLVVDAVPEPGTITPRSASAVLSPSALQGPGRSSASVTVRSWRAALLTPGAFLALWITGMLLLLASTASGWVAVGRLARRSRPLEDPVLRELADRLAGRLGVKRRFRLRVGPRGAMPMTWGVARAHVMLPADAADWPKPRLEAVLCHELAHVARWDCTTQLVAELARAVHWFNPFAWLAVWRLRVEREHACDDVAVHAGPRPSAYASELIALARYYRVPPLTSVASVPMARPSQLGQRVAAVLDDCRNRRPADRLTVLRFVALASILALPLAAATTADATAGSETLPGADAATLAKFAERDGSSAGIQVSCAAGDGDWETTRQQSNGELREIRMERRGCRIEFLLEGEIEFDGATATVEQLGSGARMWIEERAEDGRRSLEIVPGDGGRPVLDYRVDGRAASFDVEAREWYSELPLTLFRRTTVAAEARVAAVLHQDGVPGALRELERIAAPFVLARYIEELAEQAELNASEYRTVLTIAVRRADSNHYLSRILNTVAERQSLTGDLLNDFISATRALDSDHYRADALRTVLAGASLDSRQGSDVLHAVAEMDSDHYGANLLLEMAERYALEPELRDAYLQVASSLDSDHYRALVLTRMLERDDLERDEVADVLEAGAAIDSDHYRSQILRSVADAWLTRYSLQSAYFDLASESDSDHYYHAAMGLLLEDDRLDEDLLLMIIDDAARRMESDSYLSALLLGVLERRVMSGAVRERMLGAMDTIDSDVYRGRVADALLSQGRR